MRTWHGGPPPHVGWWKASSLYGVMVWRWWDGHQWSIPASPLYSAKEAAEVAYVPTDISGVEWTDYWPEGARVPRVAP